MSAAICPGKIRYAHLLTARSALHGLSEGRPQWTANAARDALIALEREEDFAAPRIVLALRFAIEAALGDCRGQREAVVSAGALMADAALAAEAGVEREPQARERYP